jgi:hypothetical protein
MFFFPAHTEQPFQATSRGVFSFPSFASTRPLETPLDTPPDQQTQQQADSFVEKFIVLIEPLAKELFSMWLKGMFSSWLTKPRK